MAPGCFIGSLTMLNQLQTFAVKSDEMNIMYHELGRCGEEMNMGGHLKVPFHPEFSLKNSGKKNGNPSLSDMRHTHYCLS
jgi:hypothetical protein